MCIRLFHSPEVVDHLVRAQVHVVEYLVRFITFHPEAATVTDTTEHNG